MKMFLKAVALFAGLALSGAISCSTQKAGREGIDIADSNKYEATIFKQNCAICHGVEGFGKTIDGKVIPSLRTGPASKKTEEEIYFQIAHGKMPMPSFKNQLTESEMRKMANFIYKDVQGR